MIKSIFVSCKFEHTITHINDLLFCANASQNVAFIRPDPV